MFHNYIWVMTRYLGNYTNNNTGKARKQTETGRFAQKFPIWAGKSHLYFVFPVLEEVL